MYLKTYLQRQEGGTNLKQHEGQAHLSRLKIREGFYSK